MRFIVLAFSVGFGAYLLWRRGRGSSQPTIRQDLKYFLTGKAPAETPLHKDDSPIGKIGSVPDSGDLEEIADLNDVERIEEVMELTDMWNRASQEDDPSKRENR